MILLTIANVQLVTEVLGGTLVEAPSTFIIVEVLFFVTVFCSLILERS
jgi:hypothetical protein